MDFIFLNFGAFDGAVFSFAGGARKMDNLIYDQRYNKRLQAGLNKLK